MAGPAADLHRFSVDEYERMADVGILPDRRLELIDGLVAAMSPRGERHWYAVALLTRLFCDRCAGRYTVSGGCLTLRLGPRIRASPISYFRAAISKACGVARAQRTWRYSSRSRIHRSPTISGRRRRHRWAGIPEYWVVDLCHDVVVVCRERRAPT